MFFDNLGVLDITGPILEETHYYPYGLTMAGISTKAPLKLEGKRKFDGIEFNHKEFSDGSGLDLYSAKFRELDPQIGRWWQIDPKPNTSLSPYAAMDLNPVLNVDLQGDTSWPIKNKWNNKTIQNYQNYAANAWKNYQKNGIKCTCEDFSLGVLIDYASENNLPLVLKNSNGESTFSAASDKFNDVGSFKEAVMAHLAASDLKANTSKSSLSSIQPGDIFGLKNANGNFHHIQLITGVNGKNVKIHQGNFNAGQLPYRMGAKIAHRLGFDANANNPISKFYIGHNIQTGNYNFNTGTYSRQTFAGSVGYGTISITLPSIQNITGLNIEPRRWNFMSWNN